VIKMALWGWLVAFDLFFGGLSAGLFVSVAALESFKLGEQFKKTLTWGAFGAWFILLLGLGTLALDLGHPERAYSLLIGPNLTSPLSWGAISITALLILSIAYWVAQTGFLIRKLLPPVWKLLKQYQMVIAILGGIFAFITGTYTGILLTYARFPLWGSAMLPLLFLASALGMGYALFLLIAHFAGEMTIEDIQKYLPRLMVVLGVLELLMTIVYIGFLPVEVRSALLSFETMYGVLFIVAFLVGGVLVGMIGLNLLELRNGRSRSGTLYLSMPLILFGGFVLRYVVVFLGPIL